MLTPTLRARVAAAAGVLTVAAGLVAATAPTASAAPVAVTNAQFRWGVNLEAGKQNYFGYNFLSAGKLGNPGAGEQELTATSSGALWTNGRAAGWKAAHCNVRIEKRQADDSWATATWAGTRTDKNGNPLTFTQSAELQIVMDGGTGTLDPATDSGEVRWTGDATAVLYSGRSFFYLSDPRLQLTNGDGTVTATLSGFGSDMDNQAIWKPLTPVTVPVATLTDVDVTADGLLVTPAYAGVTYAAPAGAAPQVLTGGYPGAFPSAFINFQQQVGTGGYWYSTGGEADRYKVPLPIQVRTEAPATEVDPALALQTVAAPYGRSSTATVTACPGATGSVTLTGAGAAQTKQLSGGKATFTLPARLAPRSHVLTASLPAAGRYRAATVTRALVVPKAGVARPTLKVTRKPTRKAVGKATVTVRSAVVGVPVTGRATVTLVKGKAKKVVAVTLRNGTAVATLPKLPKGTWKATVRYAGSATHAAGTSAVTSIAVKK